MFGYWDHIVRAGFFEERGPGGGIVPGNGEERDEVFVAELIRRAIVFGMPGDVAGIHVLRIPFVAMRWEGVQAPVDENAELTLAEPGGGGLVIAY